MRLIAFPGVYSPQDDTALLAGALLREALPPAARVLDVGTGSGALAVAAALRGARVTAVDISWTAVLTARLNARLARRRIRVLRGDLTAPVAERTFDLIVSNPPYVPSPRDTLPRRGRARAWDAGRDGRLVLDRICREVPRLLAPGGVLLVVHSALSGEAPTLADLRQAGLRVQTLERAVVRFGPVLRSRQSWLRGRGLLRPDDDAEELVVIRAERTR
ncbi:HemK2/MTQ2 family protein methyltransferase [Streptomyces sp. NPDC059352]|uniref:HemK2/MTQ2 family protein methyltransferase n=1 Tax=Streptomyces sp. NPDC059352 TaxID=3346810 RepID=UPI0036B34995